MSVVNFINVQVPIAAFLEKYVAKDALVYVAPEEHVVFAKTVFYHRFLKVVASIAPTYKWTLKQQAVLAKELFYVLRSKALVNDPMSVSVSARLDMCWHALILETELYDQFCRSICGRFLHHSTETINDDADEKQKRIQKMLLIAKNSDDPVGDKWVWEDLEPKVVRERKRKSVDHETRGDKRQKEEEKMSIYVKGLDGITYNFCVQQNTTILEVKQMIFEKIRKRVDEQRLIHSGMQLEDGCTLARYNITNNATIHLVMRLRGC